jgi:hypothetical protein
MRRRAPDPVKNSRVPQSPRNHGARTVLDADPSPWNQVAALWTIQFNWCQERTVD